jgi:hypothetical protein
MCVKYGEEKNKKEKTGFSPLLVVCVAAAVGSQRDYSQ